MSEEIRVHVIDYGSGRNLMMRYKCPNTSKQIARSTGTRNSREALKAAAKWEAELREGRYAKQARMAWQDFRAFYALNALPALAPGSVITYEATLNVFERKANPQKLGDVTTSRVTAFATTLRTEGAAEATIARHLRHLKAAMRWANKQGLLNIVPQFSMPKRVKGGKVMRGRPITGEEFDRMIEAVPIVVENAAAESWRFYLRGLWASGLRLRESLSLRWEDAPGAIVVDLTCRRPMLRIPGEAQKSGEDTLLPITPEFATLLQSVPERERRGRVFKLQRPDGTPEDRGRCVVGKTVTAIGQSAGIVVDERMKRGKLVKKFASAHDLRRSFGRRLVAMGVFPNDLRELMRHEDISTTMKYYIGTDAEATADRLWAVAGNNQGNTPSAHEKSDAKSTANFSTGERT